MLSKILDWLAPIQDLMSKIGNPEPEMTKENVDKIMSIIEAGDIILSFEKWRLTNIFIRGNKDHAAIVSAKITIVEAVKPKVQEVDLEEWLYKKDRVTVLRPKAEKYTRQLAGANSLSFLGTEYDRSFSLADKRLYCSELCYMCYAIETKNIFPELQKDDILPVDFIPFCEIIFEC